MILIIFCSIFLVIQFLFFIHLLKIRNRDKALFRFCNLRREILTYLRDNQATISESDFIEIQELLNQLSSIIHNFDDVKKDFSFKNFTSLLGSIIVSSKNLNNHQKTETDSIIIDEFKVKLGKSLIFSFVTLVPFFKWRLTAKVISIIAELFYLIGLKNLKRSEKWLKNISNLYQVDYHQSKSLS